MLSLLYAIQVYKVPTIVQAVQLSQLVLLEVEAWLQLESFFSNVQTYLIAAVTSSCGPSRIVATKV